MILKEDPSRSSEKTDTAEKSKQQPTNIPTNFLCFPVKILLELVLSCKVWKHLFLKRSEQDPDRSTTGVITSGCNRPVIFVPMSSSDIAIDSHRILIRRLQPDLGNDVITS